MRDDKAEIVDVLAYRTDEGFIQEHWRALDASLKVNPVADWNKPALLVVCADEKERDYLRRQIEAALTPVEQGAAKATELYEIYLTQLRRDVRELLKRVVDKKPMTAQSRATLAEIVDNLGGE